MTILADLLLLGAALLSLSASIGLVRFGDALARLHAATKPQVLGLLLVLAAIGVANGRWDLVPALVPVVALQLVTIPVSAHMIARAAYRNGDHRVDALTADELAPAIEAADRAHP
jgi:multicomponent Na+:H+ antiporter subunit G